MHGLITFLLTMFLTTTVVATDIPLTPYQASYALYRGGINVAISKLSLEQSGRYWRWRQISKPKGIYALFSNNSLYSETTLLRLDDRYKIHNILVTDEGDDDRYENARFNWDNKNVDIQHKNKRYLETLPDEELSLRSRVMARLSLALSWSGSSERSARYALEALSIARKLNDFVALSAALAAKADVLHGPDRVGERLEVTAELEKAVRRQQNRPGKLPNNLFAPNIV